MRKETENVIWDIVFWIYKPFGRLYHFVMVNIWRKNTPYRYMPTL